MFVFLDIDGVMVPAKGWKSPEILNDGFPAFSNKAIAALRRIISDEDTVMLTTSHKANYTIDEWKNIFSNRGLDIEKMGSLPKNSMNLSRKNEIVNWFNINKSEEAFIIVDDDKSLNELPDFLKINWIQTSPFIGLTEEHIVTIESIFHKKLKPAS